MELFESNYWKVTVFLQKIIGLWFFYDQKWKNYVAWIYVYGFTLSFAIAMGVRLINEIGVNLDIVIENFIGEMYLFSVAYKLTISIIYRKQLKKLYEQIAMDWKIMTDKDELEVMHKYTEIGRQNVMMYSAYMIIAVATFLSLPVFAPLFDFVLPLENGTRPKALPYYAEYGIDLESHYYPMITQAIFGGVGTITILVTFDLGFILTVEHVIALFELVDYRLSKASGVAGMIGIYSKDALMQDQSARYYIVQAIKLHQTVLNYVDTIEECYTIAWMVILFNNMVMVGSGCSILLMKDRPEDLLRYAVVLFAGLIHFYFIFLPGQKIINSSEQIFYSCYGCQWYNLSEKSKSLIKIMMMRSRQPSQLTGGKMFILCMDAYCNMMKTGFSIFTILRSS